MECVVKANYAGLDKYVSKKNDKTYHSLVVIDNKNDSFTIGIPEDKVIEVAMLMTPVPRFTEVQIKFELQGGQYTKYTLLELPVLLNQSTTSNK